MSRTFKDIQIIGRERDGVEESIRNWLEINGFQILSNKFDGTTVSERKWWQLTGHKFTPQNGSLIAAKFNYSGTIVFELLLKQEHNNTYMHGEFYSSGADIFRGTELDLKPNPGILGMWPRKEGYKLMSSLINQLERLSCTLN